jgi:multiple sugar transport system ATP-binding protein
MATVRLENLVKNYNDAHGSCVRAVDSINLEVHDGEFMVLVGPSGCGKSTTLRMIAGLEEISSGTLSIDGRVVNQVAPKDRDIAMVFQNYALYPHMSVYDNMAFGLRLRDLPKAEIDARVREAATMLGLEPYLDRRPKALSGGQRQRVAVGRAIVRKPKVFLFDEPLSNLDAKMRVSTRAEISKLHARLKATMIYVTHDQVEAMTMGDRICVMKDGRIMQVDTPLKLYHEPANLFVAGFIGSPAMNFLRGKIETLPDGTGCFREATTHTAACAVRFDSAPGALPAVLNRDLILGIRPEDLTLRPVGSSAPNTPALRATVELIELMGAESLVHLTTGKHALVARVNSRQSHRPGEQVEVHLEQSHAHFFDPETQERVRLSA